MLWRKHQYGKLMSAEGISRDVELCNSCAAAVNDISLETLNTHVVVMVVTSI